jgi:hypothetical protein
LGFPVSGVSAAGSDVTGRSRHLLGAKRGAAATCGRLYWADGIGWTRHAAHKLVMLVWVMIAINNKVNCELADQSEL